jgi:hypothetical protein
MRRQRRNEMEGIEALGQNLIKNQQCLGITSCKEGIHFLMANSVDTTSH